MRELANLYSCAEILAKMSDGDSLSDIFQKTKLAYQTITNSVKRLEEIGIIATKEEFTNHGKARRCFILKTNIKERSYAFLKEVDKYKSYLDGKEV